MATYIIKLGEHYLEWSTVVDAPISKGMTLDKFKDYYTRKYSIECKADINNLPNRLKRVAEKGTSSHDECLDSLLSYNRAGNNEEHLTIKEITIKYCPQ